MGSIINEIKIETTPAEAYKYVSDPRNAPYYISAIRRIEFGPKGEPVVGQAWRAEAELLGKIRLINLTLAELRPGKLVRFAISGDPPIEISLNIRPDGDGKSEVALSVETSSFPSILMNAVLGNMLSGDLRRLKAVLERNA